MSYTKYKGLAKGAREKRDMSIRSNKDLIQKVLIPAKWSNENCWIWLGALHPQNNLPMYTDHKTRLNPRRIFWEAYNPNEKLKNKVERLISYCEVSSCVNPYHLRKEVSDKPLHSKEVRAKLSKITKAAHALITHCPKGHEYSGSNTGFDKKGEWACRYCKTCKAERAKEYRNRKGLGSTRLERDYDKGGLLSLEVMDMEFKRPPRKF